MICAACREAGLLNSLGAPPVAKALHDKCKGATQCDCQHVVGKTAKAGREPK